jgi:5-methyltetrahydropteroyltriglutamate--homocysteine methyltransferase
VLYLGVKYMRGSKDRILTTHAGSLPRPPDLIALNQARAGGRGSDNEWRVWKEAKLPDGKVLIPGVVSHATNIVEHPQVVADRIVRYADIVGRENVIAGTDCGLGGRIHPQVGWAKLEALAEGAKLATAELWR